MTDSEKLLKDLNLRLALFGNPDIGGERSLLPQSTPSLEVRRLHREIVSKLVFKIE